MVAEAGSQPAGQRMTMYPTPHPPMHLTRPLTRFKTPAGDLQTKDAAAHTAWMLVKDDRRLLSPAKDALGVPGIKLVDPLIKVIAAGECSGRLVATP